MGNTRALWEHRQEAGAPIQTLFLFCGFLVPSIGDAIAVGMQRVRIPQRDTLHC